MKERQEAVKHQMFNSETSSGFESVPIEKHNLNEESLAGKCRNTGFNYVGDGNS